MSGTVDTRTKLLTENPYKLLISMSLPGVIGMVVLGLYSFMDAIFVGQMVGSNAMTAIGVAYPFTLLNNGISTLLGMGSASVLSRAIGKNDTATVDKIMGNMIALVLLLSAISTFVGIAFTKPLLSLTGATGEVMELAIQYLRVIFIGSLFVNFAQAANMIMRGEGAMKKAMSIMAMAAVLNIILDPIFIHVMKPYGFGIEGAAVATVLTQIVQAIFTLLYFRGKSKVVRIHRIKIDKILLPQVLAVGVSAMLMQVLTMVMQTVMFQVASQHGGTEWQTVLTAALKIQGFAFVPLWGMSQGFQPCVGTNFGAKKFDRVRIFTKVFCIGATALALLFYIPAMLVPKAILSLFIKENTIVELGYMDFRLMFSIFIVFGFMIVSITLFQALGKAKLAAYAALGRQIILFVPAVILLPKIGGLGIHGVFLAPVVTESLVAIFCLFMVMKLLKNLEKDDKIEI
ncbi:MATE family efflux transporter [Lachnospiraceae bacterium LCP25S3_G4]